MGSGTRRFIGWVTWDGIRPAYDDGFVGAPLSRCADWYRKHGPKPNHKEER